MKVFTVTYGTTRKEPEKHAEDMVLEDVGTGTEFEVLETSVVGQSASGHSKTLQVDVRVPDSVTADYFGNAETVAEAGYTFE